MNKRIKYILYFFVVVFFIASTSRLFYLTVIKKDEYKVLLNEKTNKTIEGNSAPRGRILDRNGNILVDNVGTKTIIYTKLNDISTKDEVDIAYKLAEILKLDDKISELTLKNFWILLNEKEADNLITKEEYQLFEERKLTTNDLKDKILERVTEETLKVFKEDDKNAAHIYMLMNKGYKYEKKVIKSKNVSDKEYATIIESKIKGITGELSWERAYPYGNTFRTILGNVSSETVGIPEEKREEYLKKGYSLNDRVGISYLELQYEEYLKGEKDIYQINSDNTLTIAKEGKRGNDLVLSIDINLQKQIEKILESQIKDGKKLRNTEYFNSSYVIISDPNNGAILAISGKQLLDSKLNPTFKDISIDIINSSFTMGSVVKGASMTVGYQNNLIKKGQKINDSCVKLYNVPAKCSWKRLGYINEITALRYSSNYYQFLIAINSTGNKYSSNMKLNVTKENFDTYRDTFKSYGLGTLTEIDLPNEKTGIIGDTVAADLLLNLAIGQYDTYTPIELVQYVNTVANGGKRMAPSLMLEILDNDGNIILKKSNEPLNTVEIKKEDLQSIQTGFKEVTYYGTARGFTDLKYKPAGKTGTSESYYDSDNDGKVDVKTTSANYVMYAPYDKPKYSMVVVSPNVSHNNGKTEYLAWINRYLSKEISDFLFENYS